jgi:WD40 repeat protein
LRNLKLLHSWKRRPDVGSTSVAFGLEGQVVLSSGHHDFVRVWDAESGKELPSLGGADDVTFWTDVTSDGKLALTAHRVKHAGPCTLRLWDLKSRNLIKELKGHTKYVYTARFASDGATILSGSADRTLRLWDASTGTELWRFTEKDVQATILAVAFALDGKRAASAGSFMPLRLWTRQGNQLKEQAVLAGGHVPNIIVQTVAFTPDGRFLASGAQNGQVVLWDTATGKMRRQWQWPAEICALAFAPDGRHLAVANGNGALYILRLPTGAG